MTRRIDGGRLLGGARRWRGRNRNCATGEIRMDIEIATERRDVFKALAALGALTSLSGLTTSVARADESTEAVEPPSRQVRMVDIPLSPDAKITVERREAIVLIGINRPSIQNRLDPEAIAGLARAYYDYDHDPSLRAAILFGHGDNFSRGIDVDGFKSVASSGGPPMGDG